ncbi:MAG: DEAD/DEAH box helicase [Deltaproteobacteria bacterium]|nr:DEAD/DEAH box helicase [Deltaproteobacteria bacterium]
MISTLPEVKSVDDYIARFVPELTSRLNSELAPLYDPAREAWDPLLATFRRKPFRAQGDAMMAIDRLLERQNFALLVGEMGTGKTLMGAGLAYLHLKDRYRVLIMAPGHLVGKWAREVEETIPNATARIVWKVSDLLHFKTLRSKPKGREYFILPRDRAKLGYRRRAAYFLRRHPYVKPPKGEEADLAQYVACPSCGEFAIDERTRSPKAPEALEAKAQFCKKCRGALWKADRSGVRRYAPAEFVKRYCKGVFDLFIADEVHELKGADTAQGNALGMLASVCRKTVCLTGTLVGGYAEHLFYILYRLNARGLLAENIKYSQVQHFIARYGALEFIKKTHAQGPGLVYSRGSQVREYVRHRPGVSPLAFARHLLTSSVFVELADVAEQLPAFGEDVTLVGMSPELSAGYREIEQKLKNAMHDRAKAARLMGAYLTTLLAYPDRPYDNKPIPDVGTPKELPRNVAYPKEQALLEFVQEELAEKRRVWVYATYTNTRDVTGRLADLFRKKGIKAAVLKQETVEMSEREEWIQEQVKAGVEVVISNPELVKTGLDLLAFPTLAFYECGYNTFTLMQASRRSWRIGQALGVKVRYFCYKQTLQEAALRLMGAKVKATQALQGKFSAEGLVALTQSEDMVSALAKALMNGLEGVESAETYWRNERSAGQETKSPAVAIPVHAPRVEETPTTDMPERAPARKEWVTVDLFSFLPPRPARPKRAEAAAKPLQLQIAF